MENIKLLVKYTEKQKIQQAALRAVRGWFI
jgi:hypothetical protein